MWRRLVTHGPVSDACSCPARPRSSWSPTPGEHGIDAAEQKALTIASLAQLHGRQLHFAQVLLLPDAEGQRRLLEQVGFRRLAPLLYLERDARYPWVDPPEADESAWVEFRPETRDAFAATLLATYEESLDCPELANLRPIDDILAGHRAAGRFNPRFWELLRVDGQNAACLLLNALSPARTLELVYMGVRTEFRQRGIGSLLLQRALQRCRDSGARRLTVAVDDRNDPAKRLYARFALRSIARREVYLYRWATGGEQAAKPADDRAHEGPETGDCASVG